MMSTLRHWLTGIALVLTLCFFAACGGAGNLPNGQNASSGSSESKWYEGGTLHEESALVWQTASRENKLATCADFVTALWQKGQLKPSIASKLSTVDDVRPYAEELMEFLDGACKAEADPDKNRMIYANQTVSSMAAIGFITLRWVK